MNLEDFRRITESNAWNSYAFTLVNNPTLCSETKTHFGIYWIEGGPHIREQLADDQILVRLLRHMLPIYDGKALTLFRGENQERWRAGQIGFAWTVDIDVARMFGRGINSIHSGGILLEGHFEPEAIIAGPNAHSSYLGEGQFTVDPFSGISILAVETYPPMP